MPSPALHTLFRNESFSPSERRPGGLFAPAGRPKPLPRGEPFHLHDTAPLRWNKWRSSYKLNDTSLNISCSPTWRSSPDWRSTYFASWAQVRHLGEVCFMALVRRYFGTSPDNPHGSEVQLRHTALPARIHFPKSKDRKGASPWS